MKKIVTVYLYLLTFLLKANFAYAEDTTTGICNPIIKGLCGENNAPARFGGLISSIFSAFLIVGVFFTLFNLFTGGLMWITSGGDKAGLENARNRILNAVIGLGVLAASWAIFIIISQFLGLGSGFGFSLPTLFSQ